MRLAWFALLGLGILALPTHPSPPSLPTIPPSNLRTSPGWPTHQLDRKSPSETDTVTSRYTATSCPPAAASSTWQDDKAGQGARGKPISQLLWTRLPSQLKTTPAGAAGHPHNNERGARGAARPDWPARNMHTAFVRTGPESASAPQRATTMMAFLASARFSLHVHRHVHRAHGRLGAGQPWAGPGGELAGGRDPSPPNGTTQHARNRTRIPPVLSTGESPNWVSLAVQPANGNKGNGKRNEKEKKGCIAGGWWYHPSAHQKPHRYKLVRNHDSTRQGSHGMGGPQFSVCLARVWKAVARAASTERRHPSERSIHHGCVCDVLRPGPRKIGEAIPHTHAILVEPKRATIPPPGMSDTR